MRVRSRSPSAIPARVGDYVPESGTKVHSSPGRSSNSIRTMDSGCTDYLEAAIEIPLILELHPGSFPDWQLVGSVDRERNGPDLMVIMGHLLGALRLRWRRTFRSLHRTLNQVQVAISRGFFRL
jgi:hypothetical protein